jgi:hypothetical protein
MRNAEFCVLVPFFVMFIGDCTSSRNFIIVFIEAAPLFLFYLMIPYLSECILRVYLITFCCLLLHFDPIFIFSFLS